MDPSVATSTKAAWSLLAMVYKKYGSQIDDGSEFPLLEWARSIYGREIPSLKRYSIAALSQCSNIC
jgi:hypothetical protein